MSVLFFGDSIAHGYRTANKATGVTKVGANPTQVLSQITTYLKTNPSLAGKTVYLSSGYSNGADPANLTTIKKQINTLKAAGADVILLGVSNTFKGSSGMGSKMNNHLNTLAGETGAKFVGGFTAGKDNVHPKSYANLAIEPSQPTQSSQPQTPSTVAPTQETPTQAPQTSQEPLMQVPQVQPFQAPQIQPVDLFGGTASTPFGLNLDLFTALPPVVGGSAYNELILPTTLF